MVKFRPKDMKISRKELSRSLEGLVTWTHRGDSKANGNPSIMVSRPVPVIDSRNASRGSPRFKLPI